MNVACLRSCKLLNDGDNHVLLIMVYYRYCNSLYGKVKEIRGTAFSEIRKEWMNVPEGVLEFNLEFANQVEWAQLRRKRKNWGHIVFSVEVQKDCCEAFSIEAVALLFFEVSLLRQDVRNEGLGLGLGLVSSGLRD